MPAKLARFVQIALVLMVLAPAAEARWSPSPGSDTSPASPRVTVTDNGGGALDVLVTVPGVDVSATETGAGPATAITVPGCAPTVEAGSPELPVLARALPLPGTGTPQIEIVDIVTRRLAVPRPMPSRGPLTRATDPESVPLTFGPVYAGEEAWPAVWAQTGRPFLLRDRRGAALQIHPVRWRPSTGELDILVSLRLRVTVDDSAGANPATGAASPTASLDPVVRSLFGDHMSAAKAAPAGPERLLIVTTAAMMDPVGDLAAWKRERGFAVEILDVADLGGRAADIGAAVAERYAAPEGLAYLLLVGDVPQVPTNAGGLQGADSDGMYGLLAGDDLFVDIAVGRLPARDADEAALMIARTIAYERDPAVGDDWFAIAAGIASDEGRPADYERADDLRQRLIAGGFDEVARIYQGFGGGADDIERAINGGAGLVNYLGHGAGDAWLSVPFDNSDVHRLTNTDAWPVIVDVSCSNGDLSEDECFAEAWLRSRYAGRPAGAVAMLSASTLTSWVPPCVMQETIIDGLLSDDPGDLGALHAAGIGAVLVQYDGTDEGRKLMEQYNLFGDPSLRVRTGPAQALTAAHDGRLPVGAGAITVTVAAGARAVLTDAGAVLAVADAAVAGPVTLTPTRPLVDGETVRLTVTARNAKPYRAVLPVGEATTPAGDAAPDAVALLGNWPNPFNPATSVGYALPAAGPVRLSIHDARGRLVRVLVDDVVEAGSHQAAWDGRDGDGRGVAAGVYLARLQAGGARHVTKLTLVR